MKMRWEEPRIEVQMFEANEYVAACTKEFNCGAGVPTNSWLVGNQGENVHFYLTDACNFNKVVDKVNVGYMIVDGKPQQVFYIENADKSYGGVLAKIHPYHIALPENYSNAS